MPRETRTVDQEPGSVTKSIHAIFESHPDRIIRGNDGREFLHLNLPVTLISEGKVLYPVGRDFPLTPQDEMRVTLERNDTEDLNPYTAVRINVFPSDPKPAWKVGFKINSLDQIREYQVGEIKSTAAADRRLIVDFPRILEYAGYLSKLRELMRDAGIPESDFRIPEQALAFAEVHHRGVKRADGKPFLDHAFEVAKILVKEFGVKGVKDIAVALIHDVPEDSPFLKQEKAVEGKKVKENYDKWGVRVIGVIASYFDPGDAWEIAHEAVALSRPEIDNERILSPRISDHVYRRNISEFNIRRKKMADRLHNLRTLGAVSKRRQMDTLISTAEEYFPLFAKGLYEPGNEAVTLYALTEMWKAILLMAPANELDFETPYWAKSNFSIEDLRQQQI